MPHGDKTSASAIGPTIDPDVAEQLASSFVPAWRFDEAPFAAGDALSKEDIEALAATASGTTPSTRPTAPPPSAPEDVPLSTTQSFVAFESDPFARLRDEDEAIPPAKSAALEAPVVAVASGAPAAAKPAAELYGFEEPKVVRGPSRGLLLLGAGAGVAAILALLAVAFHRTESPARSIVAVQIAQAPESIPIPPPLPDPIEPPPPVVSAAPILSASRPEPPAAPAPPRRASTDPAPARPRSASPPTASPPTKSVPEPGPAKSNAKPAPTRAVAVPDFGI
jgi:hypothetical protein